MHHYHCVCVLLQLVSWHVFVMLLEQVTQERLKEIRLHGRWKKNGSRIQKVHPIDIYLPRICVKLTKDACVLVEENRKKWQMKRWMSRSLKASSGQRSVIGSAVNNRCAFVWSPYLELLSRYVTTAVDVILPPDLWQEMVNQCKQMWTVDLCEYIYRNLIWHRGGIRWWRM